MLRPFLIVGVGGSGGKTIRGLRHALELRLQQVGWRDGIPTAWQMLHFDTPLAQDGTDYGLPFLPAQDYKGMVAAGGSYEGVHGAIVLGKKIAGQALHDVERQLPDPGRVPVDVTKGAGQFRAVGRAVALSRLAEIEKQSSNAINRMSDASSVGQLRTLGEKIHATSDGGATVEPTVIIISSIAGGSGAGQYLDVIEAIKSGIRTQPWAHQFFSLLYAPDVFDQVKGSAGIPSNALATVSETMNGFWTQEPSVATRELFNSKGLSLSMGSARDKVGAAYPFIIGRQNSKVAFDNQGEVYSAVAASVAAWMTDDKVQDDIGAYATGNWTSNTGASVLPDATRLMRPSDQSPPFSSLGFGRVSLGRERFLDYACERFGRAVVDRMLFAHTEEDPAFEQRTQEEWIHQKATQNLQSFIKATGLDEESEERNDVIDALRAGGSRHSLGLELRSEVLAKASQNLDKSGGLDLTTWQFRLTTSRDDLVQAYLARDVINRQEKLSAWLETMPQHIVATVERYISQQGLAVTLELLKGLSRTVKAAEENLLAESEMHRGWVQSFSSLVSEALGQAANQDSMRPDQDAVEEALDRIVQSFDWEAEARLRQNTSALLSELRKDFLDPLRTYLSGAYDALLSRVSEQVQSDGRENPYDFWPRRSDKTVPRKYTPAPNERLLVEATDYPNEFNRLVSSSMNGQKFDDAMFEVMTQVLMGPDADSADSEFWSLIATPRSWKPAVTADAGQVNSSPTKPRFQFADLPQTYADRARSWMLQPGAAFHSYITQDFSSYFDADELDPNEFKKRKDKFREAFNSALGTSEPLVRLNPALLSEIHSKAVGEGTRLVFSAIPFASGSEMYEVTKNELTSHGVWDETTSKGWFKDARVNGIDVFAMSGFPYQPIVMDSVMAPIAKGWLAVSNTAESRADFWKWKRARLLREAVPADPEVFDSMIRGWYVAKALGQLTVDSPDASRGPKLGIWDDSSEKNVFFPYPLLYQGTAPSHDFPGAILESLIIALALCNADGSLAPLKSYHRLMDLGGPTPRTLSTELVDWLRDGTVPRGGPIPDAARAGAPGESLEGRQTALKNFLDAQIEEFTAEVINQDTQTSVYSYPVSWEIRDFVIASLKSLRDGVLETKVAKSGI
jgi:hypothetical protein